MKTFILGIAVVIVTFVSHAQVALPPDLVGHVTSPPGKSITATAVLCYWHIKTNNHLVDFRELPRHTRDLPRHVQADEQGNFRFASLDPALLYQVLVFAPGCQPQTFRYVDPAAGPLSVRLEPAVPTNAPERTVVRGRLRDARGNPIAGALIKILGVTRNGSRHWPAFGIDFYAVSDDTGLFTVRGETPFTATEGVVEAAGFSKALFEGWEPGDTIHELTLIEGAAFEGRLLQTGKPVADAEILIQNFGRESGSSEWHYFARTDSKGRFAFAHLPPNRSFSLYATMESLAGRGAISRHEGRVRENGSATDFGDLNLSPAFTVAGAVRLSDGKPIPPKSRLQLVRTTMAGVLDSLSQPLGVDGSFHFTGVPGEKVTIYLRIPGYQLTPRDAFLKSGSATNLTVVNDLLNMAIVMKPATGK